MRIKLHDRVHYIKTRSNQGQYCIHCGKNMPEGTNGLSITKKILCGNTMNLWCHLQCFNKFVKEVKENLKLNESLIIANEV